MRPVGVGERLAANRNQVRQHGCPSDLVIVDLAIAADLELEPPLLTVLGSAVLVGEVVPVSTGVAIAVVCLGILLMSLRGAGTAKLDRTTVVYALGTSVFIAFYTLVVGIGGRSAPGAMSYTAWLFVLDGLAMRLHVRPVMNIAELLLTGHQAQNQSDE